MTYVISDIHGCFEQFKTLLKKINSKTLLYSLV